MINWKKIFLGVAAAAGAVVLVATVGPVIGPALAASGAFITDSMAEMMEEFPDFYRS